MPTRSTPDGKSASSLAASIRILSISMALNVCGVGAGYAAAQLTGVTAPDFVLKSVAGRNIRLSEYRGQVVMLTFWASWCGDCRAQLEGLAQTYARYHDAGVELLSVNLDADLRTARDAAAAMGLSYPVLHDAGGEVGRVYEVDAMPLTVLIDRDGIVREVFEGFRRGQEEQYLESVRELLREF